MGRSMAEFGRRILARRVLDEKASCDRRDADDGESSGSEHEGAPSGLVLLDGFFPFDQHDASSAANGDGDSTSTASNDDGTGEQHEEADEDRIHDDNNKSTASPSPSNNSIVSSSFGAKMMIRDLMNPKADRFRRDLLANVTSEVAERLGSLRLTNKSAFRRAVMSSLREKGYNAGICKSRWGAAAGAGGITPGSYEYIDVVVVRSSSSSERRYIVDPDFASEFEIARPTEEYVQVLEELPTVLVGKEEVLRKVLRVVGDAARRSLRSREMHVPPWRKTKYLEAKWLGPYKRTTNHYIFGAPSSTATHYTSSPSTPSMAPMPPLSSAASATAAAAGGGRGGEGVQYCRAVGFQLTAAWPVIPAAARIR